MDTPVTHRHVDANGIRLHVAEQGSGPPVVLCHGFPDLWFSWRRQLPALAEVGYRAIALDMRGYGDSDAPADPDAYDILTLTGDLVALLDAIGEERAVFVGHDWGAAVVWELTRLHPERVAAMAAISVPFAPRSHAPPVSVMRRRLGEDFYMVWFQRPGVADAALAEDVRRTLTARAVWDPEWLKRGEDANATPPWRSEEELDVYVTTFERTGFTGGLNYYRNLDRSWELTERFADRTVERPALFVTGSRDPVRRFMPGDRMAEAVADLRTVTIDGAGHWVQEERAEEVNSALLRFLAEVGY